MPAVLGIGGVFLRFRDQEGTARWYRDHLGIALDERWWGTSFPLKHPQDRPGAAVIWAAFAHESDYLGARENQVMINFRVADLDEMLASLRAAGCAVDDRVERSDFGAFGWVTDPEGHRIELWEPPGEAPAT